MLKKELANVQTALKRTSEQKDKNIQMLKKELANAQDELQCAARQGDIAKLKALLNKPGIHADTRDTIGKTPLHYAKDAATVQLLLANGATVHAFDNNMHTPLYTAALAGRHDAVLALIKAGANAQEALQRAAKGGYTKALQTLINAGADVQAALRYAARTNDVTTLNAFINAGADVQEVLQRAARTNDVTTLKALISAGNAVEEKEGQPPWPAYAKEVLELIEKKVDINAKDNDGYTPLHTAAKAGNTAKVWALIAKGADINAKNNKRKTPLREAIDNNKAAMQALLRKHGGHE